MQYVIVSHNNDEGLTNKVNEYLNDLDWNSDWCHVCGSIIIWYSLCYFFVYGEKKMKDFGLPRIPSTSFTKAW